MEQMSTQDRLVLLNALDVLNKRATEELESLGHINPRTNQAREALNEIIIAETSPRLVVSRRDSGT
jgi:hypothetical protein